MATRSSATRFDFAAVTARGLKTPSRRLCCEPGAIPRRSARGVAVHHGPAPVDRRVAATIRPGRRGGHRRATGAAHRGRDRPDGRVLDGRGGPRAALPGAPGGPGRVLLPGALGRRGGDPTGRTARHSQVPYTLRTSFVAVGAGGNGGDVMRCARSVDAGAYILG